jgi:hypothetical protein
MPGVDWIDLAQGEVQWRILVNTGSGSIKRRELSSRATISFIRKSLLLGIIYIEKCFRDIRVAEKMLFRTLPACFFFMLGIVALATNGRLLTSLPSEHSEAYGLLDMSHYFLLKAAHTEQVPGKRTVGPDVVTASRL